MKMKDKAKMKSMILTDPIINNLIKEGINLNLMHRIGVKIFLQSMKKLK